MKKLPTHAAMKPHLRARKLSTSGRSSFPPTPPTAFSPPAGGGAAPDPAQAFPGGNPMMSAPGDTGN